MLPDLLRICGSELRELVVKGCLTKESDILAITTHCTKLSSLAIHGNQFEVTLAPIWRSLGSTLTRIFIGTYIILPTLELTVNVISVPDLVEHCGYLHRVDIEHLDDDKADILIALGSRIRVLDVGLRLDPNITSWRKVCKSCTNLETIHLAVCSSAEAIDLLSLIRTKLVYLKLYDLDNLMSTECEDQFFSVLSTCSALKEITLYAKHPIPETRLRKLYGSIDSATAIRCHVSTCVFNPVNIIRAIARNLARIESISITTVFQLKADDVRALINLPHLKYVRIWRGCYNSSAANPAEKHALQIVKNFKDCTQLVQLEIDDVNIRNRSSAIAEPAAMYHRTDFDMFIGGVQYRTW